MVIVADVTYTYTPAFGGKLLAWEQHGGSLTFSHTTYMRPRNRFCIYYGGSSGTVCTANPAPRPNTEKGGAGAPKAYVHAMFWFSSQRCELTWLGQSSSLRHIWSCRRPPESGRPERRRTQ